MSDQPTVVHEFEISRGWIRASVSQFRGKQFVDLRLWVEPRDQPGAALIPTRKGVSVPIEFLDELGEAVDALAAVVHRGGRAAP